MAETSPRQQQAWLAAQVREHKRMHKRYEDYADKLEQVLKRQVKQIGALATIQSRAKTIPSFAEKALRRHADTSDPVHDFRDLCGGRVICRTPSEVEAVCRFVEEQFEIDVENSAMKGQVDLGWRSRVAAPEGPGPTEFGYRSIHYIVRFKQEVDYGVSIPAALYGLWAEVQVRTIAEHSWADFGHDLSYKGAFELPVRWQRELAIIAAQLEDVDRAYDRIEHGLRTYASSYGAYLSEEQLREEIATLETVRKHDARNPQLAARIGKLAISLGDWEKAVDVMSDKRVLPDDLDAAHQALLRDLGVALCKLHDDRPTGREYGRGQRYLKKSVELSGAADADALASLAGTWRRKRGWRGDEQKARELYRRAFEADPSDFYPLVNFLEYEIRRAGDTAVVAPLGPSLRTAIARCRAQADVGINLPWAFFGMAELHLLLDEPHASLRAYAKAVQASTAEDAIVGALRFLKALAPVRHQLKGYEWARQILVAGRAARFASRSARAELRRLAAGAFPNDGSVVIVVGGTDPSMAATMRGYRDLMHEAFRDFGGTIISGGTKQGVSGLAGLVARRYSKRIRAVGYLPRGALPRGATEDPRYAEIRRTGDGGFSPLQPLQNWIDLIASGIDPASVKLLGINGGDIAAVEYRIALALGASVGVVEQSGREASKLLADEQWAVADNLAPLPHDPETVRAFIGSGAPKLAEQDRESIAREIHERHRKQAAAVTSTDPLLQPWEDLDEELQDSSLQQADHIEAKLREIGCSVHPVSDREIVLMSFGDDEVERLSEMEHGRWNAERLAAGWRWGEEKDPEKKTHPSIVPWRVLPEEIRDFDRETVRAIPTYLATVGLEVRRGR